MLTEYEQVIREQLGQIACRPPESLRSEQLLLDDLNIDGDDYSWFTREIQRILRIRPTRLEWESVYTVGDVLRLVQAHVTRRALEGDATKHRGSN
jgi:hypothetical protein